MPTERRPKQEQILAAAADLFLERGYGRTSMDMVVRRAGVSKQTLYIYFPSKDALFLAAVERELAQFPARAEALPTPATVAELRASLLDFALGVGAVLGSPRTSAFLRVVVAEAAHVPQVRQVFRDQVPLSLMASLRDLLVAASDAGIVAPGDVEANVRLFFGSLVVTAGLDGILGDGQSPLTRDTAAALVDALLVGMAPSTPRTDASEL